MKIKRSKVEYGCFTAYAVCEACDKVVLKRPFSWESDHIGAGENEKITGVMEEELAKKEIIYCCKCGKKLET